MNNIKVTTISLLLALSQCIHAADYKIGLAVWSGYPDCVEGFKQALSDAGLREGEQVEFIQGEVGADKGLQREVAHRLKEADVDLVFSLTTPGTTIIKEVMPDTTPIVFSIVTYPADSGLIESFEYSGNNLVGTSNYVPLRHSVDLLKLIVPKAGRVAIFHRKGEPNSKIQASSLYRLFKRSGIEVLDFEPETIEQVKTMALSVHDQVDLFVTTTDTLMQSGGEAALIDISLDKKVPILSSNMSGVEQGATFGVVTDFRTLGTISGEMAVQILKDKVSPERLKSMLQEPPIYLVNKKSMAQLGIRVMGDVEERITWFVE